MSDRETIKVVRSRSWIFFSISSIYRMVVLVSRYFGWYGKKEQNNDEAKTDCNERPNVALLEPF